jgi:hypothetical protein
MLFSAPAAHIKLHALARGQPARQQTVFPQSLACYSQRREHTSSFQRRRTAWGVAFLRWLQTERAVVPLDYVLNVGGFNLEKVDDDVTCC